MRIAKFELLYKQRLESLVEDVLSYKSVMGMIGGLVSLAVMDDKVTLI